jgi:hypothetical protein
MLYNTENTPPRDGDCGCHGNSHMPQCQLYQPFIGLEKDGKAPEIKYDLRARHAISTLSSTPMWLNHLKIKAAYLSVNSTESLVHLLTSISDDAFQRDFLEILAGTGSKFGIAKNPNLLECIDPLTVKWHSNTSILELIESFYAQAEKQREQDITFALAAREKAMSAVESAQQAAASTNNLSVQDLNNLTNGAIAAVNSIFHTNFSNVPPSGSQTAQIPTVPPPYRRPSIAETIETAYALTWVNPTNPSTTTMDGTILNYINFIIRQLHLGKQPSLHRTLDGTLCVKYVPQMTTVSGSGMKHPQPRLFMLNHYKTATYDGQYGMSRVVKTLSLLPKEKTTVTIKSYKNSTYTRTRSENILDSFSEASSKEFTDTFNHEVMNRNTKSTDWSVNGKVENTNTMELKVPLDEISAEVGSTQTNGLSGDYKVHDGHEEVVKTLRNTFEKHTSSSSHNRKVEVNTNTTETINEGYEEVTVRTLENINSSRVLNFVYRQMYQQFLTVTYLEDVSFLYSLGYPESEREISLAQLPNFLNEICSDPVYATSVLENILMQLCYVRDYNGTMQQFIQCDKIELNPCCPSMIKHDPMVYQFPSIVRGLIQEIPGGINVPGIVLNIDEYVLPTDDLICDALLGAGEALDCYNIRLQQAAVTKVDLENEAKYLENEKMKQAISILNMIEDPKIKAQLYKKVFGTCCDVPQVGCGCNTCNDGVETKAIDVKEGIKISAAEAVVEQPK